VYYIYIYIIYIGIRQRHAVGRRCSSRNRLGEQNPDETKMDRIIIIIIIVEKKDMHSAVCVPISDKRWNRPKINVPNFTDWFHEPRVTTPSVQDRRWNIRSIERLWPLYNYCSRLFFARKHNNILIWRLIFRLQRNIPITQYNIESSVLPLPQHLQSPQTTASPHTSKYLYTFDENKICSLEREISNPLQQTALECFETNIDCCHVIIICFTLIDTIGVTDICIL